MKAAYADPPYLGCAEKHYGDMHAQAADYDDPMTHKRLIERLTDEYESWALSMNEPSLRVLLPMCPSDCRTGVWVKSFASFKANVTRAWAWEPVVFRFSRPRTRQQATWRDFVVTPITLKKGFTGAKPFPFCAWVFDGLNLLEGDDFHDLFPGSGSVAEAYETWKAREGDVAEQFSLGLEGADRDDKRTNSASGGGVVCPACGIVTNEHHIAVAPLQCWPESVDKFSDEGMEFPDGKEKLNVL